jgi:hypothetical protein
MTRLVVLDDEALQAVNENRRQLLAAGIGSAISFRPHGEPPSRRGRPGGRAAGRPV